jgi:hypothetical protein
MDTKNNNEMAKRFISTDLFREDWYLELDIEVRLFFIYAITNCDHAGVLKANVRAFNALNGTQVGKDTILEQINSEKQRIKKISESKWFINDFIKFQYGDTLNPANRAHASVIKILEEEGINYDYVKPLTSPLVGVKDKEKDKDKDKAILYGNHPELTDVSERFRSVSTSAGYDPMQVNSDVMAKRFFEYYESQGWKKANGMPIHKWQPLVSTWFSKEKSNFKGTPKTTRTWD